MHKTVDVRAPRIDAYLKARPGSAALQLVYPVPTDVRPLLGGRRYLRRSTGSASRAKARQVAARLIARWEREFEERRRDRSSAEQRASGRTIRAYVPHWTGTHISALKEATRTSYCARALDFENFLSRRFPQLNGMPMHRIEDRHVQAYVNHLVRTVKLAPKSVAAGHMTALRSLCRCAVADGEMARNPSIGIKLPRPRGDAVERR